MKMIGFLHTVKNEDVPYLLQLKDAHFKMV